MLLLLLPLAAAPAHAEDSYRYWSYWWGSQDSWQYAASGPADRALADGDVEGWLYLTSAEAVPTQRPATTPDFAGICGDTEAGAGEIRVAVVLDYGTDADVPQGDSMPEGDNPDTRCVTIAEGSTGEQAVAAAADVRSEQGAVCGVNGYPAAGCFEVVAAPAPGDAEAAAEAGDDDSGIPVWPVAGGFAVLAAMVVVVVVVLSRRNASAA